MTSTTYFKQFDAWCLDTFGGDARATYIGTTIIMLLICYFVLPILKWVLHMLVMMFFAYSGYYMMSMSEVAGKVSVWRNGLVVVTLLVAYMLLHMQM